MSDELTRKVEEMRAAQARLDSQKKREDADSVHRRISKEVVIIQRFVLSLGRVLAWMWWNLGNPFLNMFTVPVIKRVFSWYVSLWTRFVFTQDEYGKKRMSYRRGTGMVIATFMVFYSATGVLSLVVDAALYATTAKIDEEVYLFNATDNSFSNDDFSVTGCEIVSGRTGYTCDDDDTLYYRIDPSWFNHAWSFVNHRNWFLPEVPAAPIANGWNRCTITSYGLRIKFLVRNLNWYVQLLSTRCSPIILNPEA